MSPTRLLSGSPLAVPILPPATFPRCSNDLCSASSPGGNNALSLFPRAQRIKNCYVNYFYWMSEAPGRWFKHITGNSLILNIRLLFLLALESPPPRGTSYWAVWFHGLEHRPLDCTLLWNKEEKRDNGTFTYHPAKSWTSLSDSFEEED